LRKCEQGNRVQHKNGSERDGNLFLARIGDWAIAAIALPPQMAVPAEMNKRFFASHARVSEPNQEQAMLMLLRYR